MKTAKRRLGAVVAAAGLAAGMTVAVAPAAEAKPTGYSWQLPTKAQCERHAYALLNNAFRSGWKIKSYEKCQQSFGGGSWYGKMTLY
ncbi:hypothetical protein [Brevibacterium moorei]|jgi:hypothetical protein|uniref:hypothetical protein n=1 Tax=Brevibacterium moorei TaxID=2968457 RepID=UPI00211BAD3A|nr:hypothetical protein [Brevibacterium sp. 68QC2CO]MCQ9386420.1 hypothetical protein [Brevibacterium sp. 68QC2CO]